MANTLGAEMELIAALGSGAAVVIADMTATRFCDGTTARMLATVSREAAASGAEFRVAASPPVRQILALTGLAASLPIYSSLSAALAGEPPRQNPR